LIEHAFVAQLEATAQLSFDPDGVIYDLRIPLTALNGTIAPP